MDREEISSRILLPSLLISVFLLAIKKVGDYDIWWHLATGRAIVTEGLILRNDPFSYTSNLPWSTYSWLGDVILYGVYRLSGIEGLILFKALILAATFYILYLTIKVVTGNGWSPALSVLILAVGAFSIWFRMFLRPFIFELLFIALFVYILELKRCKNRNLLHLLPLIQILWVNIHGASATIGMGLPLLYLTGGMIKRAIKGGPVWKREEDLSLTLSLLAVILATALNPKGFRTVLMPFLVYRETYMSNIGELQPIRPEMLLGYGIRYLWGFLILFMLGLFSLLYRYREMDPVEVTTFSLFSLLAFRAVRLVSEFTILAIPVVARGLHALPKLKGLLERYYVRFCISLIIPLIFISSIALNTTYSFGLGLKERVFPERASDFIEEVNLRGNMFNSIAFGAYLAWRFYPERKVFIDGRNDVYPDSLYRAYLRAHRDPKAWKDLAERYGIDWVILEYSRDYGGKERMPHLMEDPNWALVYWDRVAIVLARRGSGNEDVIRRYGYRYARPNNMNPTYLNRFIDSGLAGKVIDELKRNLTFNPDNEEAHLFLAYVYYRLGMREKELREMEEVVRINPSLGFAHAALGELYLEMGQREKARKAFKRALEINPEDRVALYGMERLKNPLHPISMHDK